MADADKRRLERAKALAKEVKKGTYIPASFDRMESFFPQRQIIKKDRKEIEKIYRKDV